MLIVSFTAFCAGVSAAIAVKLASSIDDVLWLSTFLTPHVSKAARIQNAMTYIGICLLQTCLAYILSQFGQSVIDDLLGGSDSERMSTDRLLTLISGSALFVYSIVLGIDYYQENFGDNGELYKNVDVDVSIDSTDSFEDSDGNHEVVQDPPSLGHDLENAAPKPSNGMGTLEIERCPGEEDDQEEDDAADPPPYAKKSRSLAIIAFLGSLDDLALFVPMLVGKAFGILELIVGAMFATFMIVIMCVFLTRCRIVADLLEKIPLVAIVFTFSVILLIKGIVFMA